MYTARTLLSGVEEGGPSPGASGERRPLPSEKIFAPLLLLGDEESAVVSAWMFSLELMSGLLLSSAKIMLEPFSDVAWEPRASDSSSSETVDKEVP